MTLEWQRFRHIKYQQIFQSLRNKQKNYSCVYRQAKIVVKFDI